MRRVALDLTQADAARRSGVSYATWRRMEAEGRASIEDLARAAIVLRCEEGLAATFEPPPARTLDALIAPGRQRARTRTRTRTHPRPPRPEPE